MIGLGSRRGGGTRRAIEIARLVLLSVLGTTAPNPVQAQTTRPGTGGAFLDGVRPQLEQMVDAHHGVVGITVLDPSSGDMFAINGDETFPSASLVKLAVMVDVYYRVSEGQLRLADPLTFLDIDRTGGSGVLQFLTAPLELRVWDALFLMITLSDNTATNLLLAKLPPRAVTQRMRSLGLTHTQIFVRVNADPQDSFAPDSARTYGLGVTTPNEIAALLAKLYRRELVNPTSSDEMMSVLSHQFYREGLPRHLPPGVEVAHKTGTLAAARNDCGVVYGPVRPFVICVMTKDNEDRRWTRDNEAERLIGDVSRTVYDALNPTAVTHGSGS